MNIMDINLTLSPNISKKNSFGFLRFFFAFSVFFVHFGALVDKFNIWWPISGLMGVNGFFIISGFLIMRSFLQCKSAGDYAMRRLRRIVPAYMLVVILCAVSFSLISSLSFHDYFSSTVFYKYLIANLSCLNFIQPTLPDVFTNNPLPYINGSLWTIKVEITLYVLIPVLALLSRRKPLFVLTGLYILSFLFIYFMAFLYQKSGNDLYMSLSRQFLGQLRFFISGVILLFYFDEIRAKLNYLLPISIALFLLHYFFNHWIISVLFPFSFAIIIIWFVYRFKKLAVVSNYGDFSYGFYLFHFPVIQTMVHFGYFNDSPLLLFVLCFFIILLLSILSWHLLEKRVLRRK